jgi:hypothetical protein
MVFKYLIYNKEVAMSTLTPGSFEQVPTLAGHAAINVGEMSISTWKTQPIRGEDGRLYVRIIEGSDGNADRVGNVYKVVRYEFGGGKCIFQSNEN